MKRSILYTLIITVLLLGACSPQPQPAPSTAALEPTAAAPTAEPAPVVGAAGSAGGVLAMEALKNATYRGIYDDPVNLTDGFFEAEPFTVQYLEGSELYADLDSDGAEDAVVFLLERGGGTANILYMGAQLNQAGQAVDGGTVRLDEVQIKSAAVAGSQIQLEIITIGPRDGDCCPTHKTYKTYAYQDGQFVEVAGEEEPLVRVSAADLDGTNWTLVELNYDTPALADNKANIRFANEQLNGFGGCNNYNSSFTLGEDNPFVLTTSSVVSTKMACPEPILEQETAYLAAIDNTAQWGYEFGHLALYYMDDQGVPARLLFALTDAEATADDGEGAVAGTIWANPWQWISFTNPVEQYDIEMPSSYRLNFNADGTVSIKTDCNLASGEYTAQDGSLQIQIGPATLALCPGESRSEQFVQYLGSAARYFFEGGSLYIDLMADGGTLAFAPAAAEITAGQLPPGLVDQLDTFLASQVYSEGGLPGSAAPGLVLLVDTPQGRYLKAAGVASLEDGTPMGVDDILEIGSNTKSMVIAVMMQLQEEGLLSFDDKLTDWLPELAARIPNGDQVDLRMMANMATGFWDYGDPIIGEGASCQEAMRKAYTPAELIEYAIENGTPDFLPGEGFNYSNTNYILVGLIAEKASGKSLAQLFQERIFDPLGMETAVLIEDVPQLGEITTQGYWWQPDGTRLNTTDWNASQGWAAGANAMSAEDLLAYGKALGAGELFQDPDSLAQMLPYNDGSLFSLGGAYGLGLLDFGQGYWGHGGQSLGFQSLWYTNPDKGVTVVGLTNSSAYKAWQFVSVIDILEGRGLRPLQYGSLLPIAEQFPPAGGSNWVWMGMGTAEGQESIDMLTVLGLNPEGTAKLFTGECQTWGGGTYSITPDLQITFELTSEGSPCVGDESLVRLSDLLGKAESWRFENGRLVISLADGAGELIFEPLSL